MFAELSRYANAICHLKLFLYFVNRQFHTVSAAHEIYYVDNWSGEVTMKERALCGKGGI